MKFFEVRYVAPTAFTGYFSLEVYVSVPLIVLFLSSAAIMTYKLSFRYTVYIILMAAYYLLVLLFIVSYCPYFNNVVFKDIYIFHLTYCICCRYYNLGLCAIFRAS